MGRLTLEWSGRTVLVTGASSGVGRALAVALAARGCRVVLAGRDPERLREAAAAARGVAIIAELGSVDGVRRLAEEVRRAHPRLSVVVNNAAVQFNYRFADVDPDRAVDDVARELQTDLAAPIQLAALLLPTLRAEAARTGRPSAVVNVTSGLALSPRGSAAAYCAAKAGLRTFTRALRFQLRAERRAGGPEVRAVEAMLPLVDTPMTAGRGRGKIGADAAAGAILRGVERGQDEILVGRARVLPLLHRLAPGLAAGLFRDR